jgi:hypothetical protein
MQPQQPAPKKKSNPVVIGCGILVALVVLIGIITATSSHGTSSTPDTANITATQLASQPTTKAAPQQAVPTHTLKWTTVQTFSGNGTKKTGLFTVPNV